jgi:hypothetical protein
MTRRVSSFDPLIAGAQSRCGSLGRLSAKLARRRKSSFGLRRSFDHGEAASEKGKETEGAVMKPNGQYVAAIQRRGRR